MKKYQRMKCSQFKKKNKITWKYFHLIGKNLNIYKQKCYPKDIFPLKKYV